MEGRRKKDMMGEGREAGRQMKGKVSFVDEKDNESGEGGGQAGRQAAASDL